MHNNHPNDAHYTLPFFLLFNLPFAFLSFSFSFSFLLPLSFFLVQSSSPRSVTIFSFPFTNEKTLFSLVLLFRVSRIKNYLIQRKPQQLLNTGPWLHGVMGARHTALGERAKFVLCRFVQLRPGQGQK